MSFKKIKVIRNLEGDVTDVKTKVKSKPVAKYIQPNLITNYIRNRERLFYQMAIDRGDIKELERIAGYLNFEIRDIDKRNVKL